MTTRAPDPMISTAELAAAYGDPRLVVVDGTWLLPGQGDARALYAEAHLPGAVFFDIDVASEKATKLPHMLPSPPAFAAYVGRLGIADDARVVVYDQPGLFSAARVWWSLRAMGAREVRVLAGGLPCWRAEGRPLESGEAQPRAAAAFTPSFDPAQVRDLAAVQAALADGSAQVADARPAPRFRGEAPEPRAGLRSGHMPGAHSLPLATLVQDGGLKSAEGLRAAFDAAGVDPARPVIATCGSGVTAAVIALAAARLGAEASVYDGSWAEWGGRDDLPVATGEPDA